MRYFKRIYGRAVLFCLMQLVLTVVVTVASGNTLTGPLRVHPSNSRYFADAAGRAVYLTGSHVWCNLQDTSAFMGADPTADPPPVFPYEQYVRWLKNSNHNFIRLWMWEQSAWLPSVNAKTVFAPSWFARPGPRIALDGRPAFDLTTFNPEFFTRLRDRVQLAQQYGIYVGVMLFQGWSIDTSGKPLPNPWPGHPLHRANNINGIDGAPDGNGQGISWHTLNAPPAARAVQEAYIRRVVDTLNEFDNVLWEVANESSGSREWSYRVVNFIRDYESRKPKQHLIGLTGGGTLSNSDLFSSPADWVSPNYVDNYQFNPPAADGRKIVILDTDHLWGVGGDSNWVWKAFMRGLHPIYMDPMQFLTKGGVLSDPPGAESARKAMGDTLLWSRRINLAAMKPMASLCSTNYCLVNPGSEYLMYRPGSEPVVVQLGNGTYTATWFNVSNGSTLVSPVRIEGGAARTVASPFDGPAVLHLSAGSAPEPVPAPAPQPGALAPKPGPAAPVAFGVNVIGHWTFDEGSGTTAGDSSGNSNHAALFNGPLWSAGQGSGALRLDGTNDYVRVPDSASLDNIRAAITVAAWVYRSGGGWSTAPVLTRQAGTGTMEHYFLGFLGGNFCWFVNTETGSYSNYHLGRAAPVSQWVHMVGTYDGAWVRLYVNGVEHFSTPHTGQIAPAITPVMIGAGINNAIPQEFFGGMIDDVRLYNRALTAAEAAALFNSGLRSTRISRAAI